MATTTMTWTISTKSKKTWEEKEKLSQSPKFGMKSTQSIKFLVDFVPNFGDFDNFSFSSQFFFYFLEIVHVIVVVAINFLKNFKLHYNYQIMT